MTPRRSGLALHVAAAVLLAACAGPPRGPEGWIAPDPCEASNRAVFDFNDGVDRWVIDPLATGWSFITPRALRVALDKAFHNLEFPVRLVSNLGQGELAQAGSETGRFLLNTTVGIAGLFDPASAVGLGRYDEDVGQMFGRWGIAAGSYWVVPFVGSSNPRDFVGLLFDSALDLAILLTGAGALDLVNGRAIADPQVELAREAALDPYVFVRDAYLQRRQAQIRDLEPIEPESTGEPAPADALYELEDELYDLDGDEPDSELEEDEGEVESLEPQEDWRESGSAEAVDD
jgi:phospholipid-binding lipoprotein MlaA